MPAQEVNAETLRGLTNSTTLTDLLRKHGPVAREMAANILVEQIASGMSPDVRAELLTGLGEVR